MKLLHKMIYFFAFDVPPYNMDLMEQLVYYNNIQHVNSIKDWQGLVDKEQKSLTNK